MSLASIYQAAETDASASRSGVSFEDAKHDLTVYAVNRRIMHDALDSVDPSLTTDGFMRYMEVMDRRESLGGDTALSRTATSSLSRKGNHDEEYAKARELYEASRDDFMAYLEGGDFGSDPSDPKYRLYLEMQESVSQLAAASGHLGGKDHGLRPEMSKNELWADANDGVMDYLREQRDKFGISDSFSVDCTGYALVDKDRKLIADSLGMSEADVSAKVMDAKTMNRMHNEALTGSSVEMTTRRVNSAAQAFGGQLLESGMDSVRDGIEMP